MATTTQAPNPHTPQTSQPRTILTLAGIWIALLTLVFIGSHSTAHAGDGAITGLTLTSDSPGVLTINWTAASPIPTDYRVVWAESSSGFKSWKDESGNAFPTANAHTISELDDDLEYKARVRSRYFDSEGKRQKSGSWSEVVVLNLALPRKPTDILTLASSNQVVLLWNSNDDSITGYRIHRGVDPNSLEVLVEDTGNPRTDYTDIAVSPGTSYTYAIRAINGEGVSDLSDHVSASTEPDENLQSAGQEELGQTLVSTIEQPSQFGFARDSTVSSEPSIMFLKIITGDNSDGYRLDGVKVRLKRVSGSSVPKVSIRLGRFARLPGTIGKLLVIRPISRRWLRRSALSRLISRPRRTSPSDPTGPTGLRWRKPRTTPSITRYLRSPGILTTARRKAGRWVRDAW